VYASREKVRATTANDLLPVVTVKGSSTGKIRTTPNQTDSHEETGAEEAPVIQNKKLKGFLRPEVANTLFARRLREGNYAPDSKCCQLDRQLLSASIAAATRGRAGNVPVSEIVAISDSTRESLEGYRRLWPSVTTLRGVALSRACKYGTDGPTVKEVGDKYIVYTPMTVPFDVTPEGLIVNKDGVGLVAKGQTANSYILSRLDFHKPEMEPAKLDKCLVGTFLRQEHGNYTHLSRFIRVLDKRIALYWLSFAMTGLSWYDASDKEVEVRVTPLRKPKPKSKRRNSSLDKPPTLETSSDAINLSSALAKESVAPPSILRKDRPPAKKQKLATLTSGN
jgi:hypothetical protein